MKLRGIVKKISRYIFDKKYRFNFNNKKFNLYKSMADKTVLNNLYYFKFKKYINFDNPKTFNEKLQWLKLYDRNPNYTKMVDKYDVKEYISKIIGEEYIIPTIGVYEKFDNIDFDKLPNQFVMKCTHDSGGIIICKDKKKLNINLVRKKINRLMKKNFYYLSREWPYKNIKPRIIIEKYMEDEKIKEIRDYKFFCFNGEPKIMYVSDNSHTNNQHCCFFDMSYKKLNIKRKDYQEFKKTPTKPITFEKMINFSKIRYNGIPHVRVDWYEINGKLYFGELTFYTCSGFIPFENEKWDYEIGKMLKLPKKKISDINEK